MKTASKQSSPLTIPSPPLVLVILVFLVFIPLSNVSGYSSTDNTSSPNATKSWQFSSQVQNSTTVGNTIIDNKSDITSLKLVGTGYLTTKDTSTKNLSALTLSAWVKPDYSQGSPTFTIISRENQFALSINNIVPPIRTATFSVFDGMKWQNVNSAIPIGKNWTHIAATYNVTAISIYVNGTLQSTHAITGIPTISVNGELTTKAVGQISSDGDIVIGAYLNSIRGKTSNAFSGSIENVDLYDSVLDQSQITNLYDSNILSGKLGLEIKPLQVITNSNINGNLTISTNVTVLKIPINPTLSYQISKLDTVVTNSTTNANYTTPAYFIPFETP